MQRTNAAADRRAGCCLRPAWETGIADRALVTPALRSLFSTATMNGQRPPAGSNPPQQQGGSSLPPPRQEMEYLCAGASNNEVLATLCLTRNEQIAARKTRLGLENPFVARSADTVSCTKNGRAEVRRAHFVAKSFRANCCFQWCNSRPGDHIIVSSSPYHPSTTTPSSTSG